MSSGFVRKSRAPATSARCFASRVLSAVRTRMGVSEVGSDERSCSITAKPSMPGMWRSSRIRSGPNSPARSRTFVGSVVEMMSVY